jgi:hypothetical protein
VTQNHIQRQGVQAAYKNFPVLTPNALYITTPRYRTQKRTTKSKEEMQQLKTQHKIMNFITEDVMWKVKMDK